MNYQFIVISFIFIFILTKSFYLVSFFSPIFWQSGSLTLPYLHFISIRSLFAPQRLINNLFIGGACSIYSNLENRIVASFDTKLFH